MTDKDKESGIIVPDMRPKLPFGWFEVDDSDPRAGTGTFAIDAATVEAVGRRVDGADSDDTACRIYTKGSGSEFFYPTATPYEEVLKRIASALDD